METQEKADYEKFKAKKPQEIDRPFFFDVKIEILLSNSTNYFSYLVMAFCNIWMANTFQ